LTSVPHVPMLVGEVPVLGEVFDDVLVAAQAGAGWACTRIWEDLAGVVTGYLRMQGAAEPDDVASETFLNVFRSLGTFDGDEEGFRSWVFTIAHRRLIDERRRRSRRPVTTSLDARTHDPTDEGHEREVLQRVEVLELEPMLDLLSDAQRDVLLLRTIGGMSLEETAEAVGRRVGAVKQLQRRALLKLHEEVADDA